MKDSKEVKNSSKRDDAPIGRSSMIKIAGIMMAELLILIILVVVYFAGSNKPDDSQQVSSGDISSTPGATSALTPTSEPTPTTPAVSGGDSSPTPTSTLTPTPSPTPTSTPTQTPTPAPSSTPTPTPTPTPVTAASYNGQRELTQEQKKYENYIVTADIKAAMYDYDKAIDIIKSVPDYANIKVLTDIIAEYEELKSQCVAWSNNTQISHIFFHSLIYDTSLAFGPKSKTVAGYNSYMTTVSEFEKILEQMYERGYVLISIHDMAEVQTQADGTQKLVKKKIMLPEGKTPFVMSQDDVNYYDYMDADGGFATKIVVGADGKPTCEYINPDGTVVTGDFDLVPILDRFIEEHPDFSYRGAKAILAITGYEGTLGYETAPYRYDEGPLAALSDAEAAAMLEAERKACKEAVAALKEAGYEFASHTYGHKHMGQIGYGSVVYDTERWFDEVGSLLGEVDVLIYPYGEDICDWRGYNGDKYEYLKSVGFWYFCNVDSAQYWVQLKDDYMRMGRFNLDGERMFRNPEKCAWFVDTATVLDPARPYVIQ